MRTFFIHPFLAALIFSVLVIGALGAFILVPILCIHWIWNVVVVGWTPLPSIGLWQSCLLYSACACLVYLCGLVRIEFKAETLD